MSETKFRLVTRSDFDGLVCAVLLKDLDIIDDILFVHPKDMQDGKIEITENDITTNLPYVAGCHLAFDHHLSETVRNDADIKNHIIDANAPSAARVVYDYYGGWKKFPSISIDMMDAVDKRRFGTIFRRRNHQPSRLGIAKLYYGCKNRFRPFQRFPYFQLPAYDEAY